MAEVKPDAEKRVRGLNSLATCIAETGVSHWVNQGCRPQGLLCLVAMPGISCHVVDCAAPVHIRIGMATRSHQPGPPETRGAGFKYLRMVPCVRPRGRRPALSRSDG